MFSVKETDFVLYLQHLSDTVGSNPPVEEAVNAISWVHQLTGYPAIAESPFVWIVLDGLQRNLAKPKVHKEPVTTVMLSALVASLGEAPSLTEVRLVAACLLAFSAFLCYDEVAKLRCCDVTFGPQNMVYCLVGVQVPCQGDRVPVARTGSPTCPVAMLECYYKSACISTQ